MREGRKDGRRGWKRVGPTRSPPRVPETFSNLFNLGPWCVSESYLRECKIKQSDKQSFHLRLARNRFSVHLPFSFGLAGFESSQTCLRVGARLRPLHRCFDVCTQHHRVTLQVFMRRIFFSPPLCLLLSLSLCHPFLPLFPPSPLFPSLSLSLRFSSDRYWIRPAIPLSLVHFRWIINQLPLCEASRGPTADAVRSSNRK